MSGVSQGDHPGRDHVGLDFLSGGSEETFPPAKGLHGQGSGRT